MHPILSLLYLAIPYFLFFYGWLWWPYALGCGTLLAAALGLAIRACRREEGCSVRGLWPEAPIDRFLTAAVTLTLLYVSGTGGLGHQQNDWEKHNAILADLVERGWPVVYTEGDGDAGAFRLTYYLAYYLPAAVVGRLFGLLAAHLALFAWTFLGLWLAAMWVMRLVGTASWLVWAAWFMLSGMDAVGMVLRGGGDWTFMEWWPALGQYSSNVSLLVWVPQHMLPGWIGAGLIVSRAEERGDASVAALAAALTGLWSPFTTIGLAILGLIVVARTRWRSVLSAPNVLGAAPLLLVAVTYLSSIEAGDLPRGWNFLRFDSWWFLKVWPATLILEFGFYAALAYWLLRQPRGVLRPEWCRAWTVTALVTLTLLTFYRIGMANDFMMRTSIPVLFVLWIAVLRVLIAEYGQGPRWQASVLLFSLLIGAIQPWYQLGVQVTEGDHPFNFVGGRAEVSVPELPPAIRVQYLGRPDSFFFRHLAP